MSEWGLQPAARSTGKKTRETSPARQEKKATSPMSLQRRETKRQNNTQKKDEKSMSHLYPRPPSNSSSSSHSSPSSHSPPSTPSIPGLLSLPPTSRRDVERNVEKARLLLSVQQLASLLRPHISFLRSVLSDPLSSRRRGSVDEDWKQIKVVGVYARAKLEKERDGIGSVLKNLPRADATFKEALRKSKSIRQGSERRRRFSSLHPSRHSPLRQSPSRQSPLRQSPLRHSATK